MAVSRFMTLLSIAISLVVLRCAAALDANSESLHQIIQAEPGRDVRRDAVDGIASKVIVHDFDNSFEGSNNGNGQINNVSVITVACFTLAMAAATGFGAVPFFFVELEPQWAGICNGLAAGVMMAASFDLVQEGQIYGESNWVVFGILSGAIFILLCKKFLEHCGDVSMLDIRGADARKAVLVIGIMTLHSFGEGSGVGVSFAGSKGLSQGLLITLAIAVHNIPEGLAVSMVLSSRGVSPQNAMLWSIITSLPQPLVAVPSFICADTFHKVLPFCTGFAAGCMIWMVIAEVLPDAFKEAAASQVASAATISVAFMEMLSIVFQNFSNSGSTDVSVYLVSLFFSVGPLFGGAFLVAAALIFNFQQPFLIGLSSGLAFILAIWRPLQLFAPSRLGFSVIFFLSAGAAFFHFPSSGVLRAISHKKTSASSLSTTPLVTVSTLQSFLACVAVALHGLIEGLALGVAAPKAYGLGRHMVLPVSLHGLPRGAAIASCILGSTDNWRAAIAAAAFSGFASPVSAIGSMLSGLDYTGLDYGMAFACGALIPAFGSILKRAVKLDLRRGICGFLMGFGCAGLCLMSTRFLCLHTPYCNSAPEAVT